jgi:2-phospho-L-lactate guanylyltransferase
MKSALLIPVKDPTRAKTRLAGLLAPEERQRLAWAMFEDVVRAVCAVKNTDRIVLVSSYEPAIKKARAQSWDVLVEGRQSSESASVDWASCQLAQMGFDLVMRLPADVPLAQAEDIDALFGCELRPPAALMVPSIDGTGTNAILRTPPSLFPSRFGPNSLALHKAEAERVRARCLIVENPRIALDIDSPLDLKEFLKRGRGTATFDLLAEINIAERLNEKSR